MIGNSGIDKRQRQTLSRAQIQITINHKLAACCGICWSWCICVEAKWRDRPTRVCFTWFTAMESVLTIKHTHARARARCANSRGLCANRAGESCVYCPCPQHRTNTETAHSSPEFSKIVLFDREAVWIRPTACRCRPKHILTSRAQPETTMRGENWFYS